MFDRKIPERWINVETVSYIISCHQAALRTLQSVCPSVCLSICASVHLWHLFHNVFVIISSWNFQELLPLRCPCKSSRSEVKDQGHRGQNPTSLFLDCSSRLNSHMMMIWCKSLDVVQEKSPTVFEGHSSNFKLLKKSSFFYPNWAFPDCYSNSNSPVATKWYTKLEVV